MSLDKLTKRARALLVELSDISSGPAEELDSDTIFSLLSRSHGLGGIITRELASIKLPKKSKIGLSTLLTESYYQASKLEHPYVGTEHMLLSLLKLTGSTDFDRIKTHITNVSLFPKGISFVSDKKENVLIDSFGKNLTREALFGYKEPLVARDELSHLISVLLKKDNASPLLIGEPGVGKRSLIQLLVRSITSLDIPPILAGYQVIEFDLMSYITSIVNKGNVEHSLLSLQEEFKNLNRVILSVKNFQNLFMSTNIGVSIPVLYPIFREIMENSGISFIVTLSTSVYEKIALDNEHLLENFTPIDIPEPDELITRKILGSKAKTLGEFHNIDINDEMIDYIYNLAKKEMPNSAFPKKGVDLLDIACANFLVKKSKVPKEYKSLVDDTVTLFQQLDKSLAKGEYEKAISVKSKILKAEKDLSTHEDKMIYSKPIKLTKKAVDVALKDLDYISVPSEKVDTKHLSTLNKVLKKEIIGQDTAIEAVVKALIRAKLGLRSKKRPIGSFLFLGPTGVGKTELAKILAKHAFGDDGKNHIIRLDMSDFAEKHNVARLVGSPPGYVGYSEGGELTSKIEANPNSIVLFDEIEKAHPDVLNILLQITDEAELSDAKGTVFDFSKAIIILTSNLGTEILHNKEIGFVENIKIADDASVSKHLQQNLKKILKPELLNRFDEIIVFRRLTKEDQLLILELLLKDVENTLNKQNIKINITTSAKNELLKKGYSVEYGARALRRMVEKEILDKVAEIMLEGKNTPLQLHIKAGTNGLVFKRK